jgi:hypothetical protein
MARKTPGKTGMDKASYEECITAGKKKGLCTARAWKDAVGNVQNEIDSLKSLDYSDPSMLKFLEKKLVSTQKKAESKEKKWYNSKEYKSTKKK